MLVFRYGLYTSTMHNIITIYNYNNYYFIILLVKYGNMHIA